LQWRSLTSIAGRVDVDNGDKRKVTVRAGGESKGKCVAWAGAKVYVIYTRTV
jgi:hypothetical protein